MQIGAVHGAVLQIRLGKIGTRQIRATPVDIS